MGILTDTTDASIKPASVGVYRWVLISFTTAASAEESVQNHDHTSKLINIKDGHRLCTHHTPLTALGDWLETMV